MNKPYRLTLETPSGETVRACIWHRPDDGDWTVSIGGTMPRSAYTTWAETLSEAVAFVMTDMRGHLADRLPRFAVWYASVGCLPDGDYGPEFVGSEDECNAYVVKAEAEEADLGRTRYNLYQYTVEPYDQD